MSIYNIWGMNTNTCVYIYIHDMFTSTNTTFKHVFLHLPRCTDANPLPNRASLAPCHHGSVAGPPAALVEGSGMSFHNLVPPPEKIQSNNNQQPHNKNLYTLW